MSDESFIQITVETSIHASLEKAWQCWTDPAHITQWCFASADWHAPAATNDLRSGGSFTTRMEARDGSFGFDFGGVYDTVIPHQRIAYTMGDGRKVRIDFLKEADHVRVIEQFDAEGKIRRRCSRPAGRQSWTITANTSSLLQIKRCV